jgi:hypothetical protein
MSRPQSPNPTPEAVRKRKARLRATSAEESATIPPPVAIVAPKPVARPGSELGSSVEECEALASRLKQQMLAAEADPECSWTTRERLSGSYQRALAQLGSLRGDLSLSASTLSRSLVFRQYWQAVVRALEDHPEALKAARAAVAAQYGTS